MTEVDERTPGAQSTRRALQVLKAVSAQHEVGISVAEAIAATGLERSTVHRLLACLREEGFIDQDEHKRYRLGMEAMKLGVASMTRSPLIRSYENRMRDIVAKTGQTLFLVIRQGDYGLCIRRDDGIHPVKTFNTYVGTFRPLGIGVGGMALLAALEDATVARIQRRHAKFFDTAGLAGGRLAEAVATTRRTGYAALWDTVTDGVTGVGAVIPVEDGLPFAALTIAASTSQMPAQRRADLGRFLVESLRLPE